MVREERAVAGYARREASVDTVKLSTAVLHAAAVSLPCLALTSLADVISCSNQQIVKFSSSFF